jgi:hypothetical protein
MNDLSLSKSFQSLSHATAGIILKDSLNHQVESTQTQHYSQLKLIKKLTP